MIDSQIIILSGPVHSGKTTFLQKTLQKKINCFGILSPVINGKRHFVDIATKDVFLMEADEDDTDILLIGKYKFKKSSFEKASTILKRAMTQSKGTIIIDEIGPLELRGEGFSRVIHELVKANSFKRVFVVREYLVTPVVDNFKIKDFKIITTEDTLIL